MKKFLLTLLTFFIGLTVQSQSKTFLGLTLGKTYTEDEFRSIIEQSTSGEYKVEDIIDNTDSLDNLLTKLRLPAIFMIVSPNKSEKEKPTFIYTFTPRKELYGVDIIYHSSDKIYKVLADSLSSHYSMQPDDNNTGIVCYNADGMTISLEKSEMGSVSLSYSLNKDIYEYLPDIQKMFLGLELGQKYDIAEIRTSVGLKGDFIRVKREATGNTALFSKVSYAGKIWDYAEFRLTNEGQLAQFRIYDSLDQSLYERREAKKTYKYFKAMLDKKYDGAISTEDDRDLEASSYYLGGNGIALAVYTISDKSSGGSYRQYVGMTYLYEGIQQTIDNAIENEL